MTATLLPALAQAATPAVYLAALLGVAAVLDAWMPPAWLSGHWAPLRRLISVAGQNYRFATNDPAARTIEAVAGQVVAARRAVLEAAPKAALCLLLAAGLGLSCCAALPAGAGIAAAAASGVTVAGVTVAGLQDAVALYGIAKGIALQAELADPHLKPAIDDAIATTDPLAAKLQAVLSGAQADASVVRVLVAQVTQQANALTVQTAGVVTVRPNGAGPASAS